MDTLLPTQMFPRLPRARNICCGHKFCVRDTKNVSDFVQKHLVSATNVSQFAQPKKHHGQQYVRNNVSSFTRALRIRIYPWGRVIVCKESIQLEKIKMSKVTNPNKKRFFLL